MRTRLQTRLLSGALLLLSVVLLFTPSCGKRDLPPQPLPESRLTLAELMLRTGPAITGDAAFQLITKAELDSVYSEFRDELFRKDLVRWDTRFDCNQFASYYVSLAKIRHYARNWSSRDRAQSVAVGFVWYHPDGNPPGQNHAIVCAVTPEGVVYLEPQTGRYLNLSPAEVQSILLRFF